MRMWETRQVHHISVKDKVRLEARNETQDRITQMDHWTSCVGNIPKFFNIEEQSGSL
jgi:hypothetical protein